LPPQRRLHLAVRPVAGCLGYGWLSLSLSSLGAQMEQPLFDPDGGRHQNGTSLPRELSLARLAAEIARGLAALGRVAVRGEVGKPWSSQRVTYFAIKESGCQITVKARFSATARYQPRNGDQVRVVGRLMWNNDRGQTLLVAEDVTPTGAGAIAEMIARTRAVLEREGLIGRPRRPLPMLPRLVGVVCGEDAAVKHDIQSVADAYGVRGLLRFVETTVSGPEAASNIVGAISTLVRQGVELVMLARGGGDAMALLPWSDEAVCRAVADCPVPVVSAIGHEADRPLCDEVADVRFATPSLAAQRALPDLEKLGLLLAESAAAARSALEERMRAAAAQLGSFRYRQALELRLERADNRLAAARLRLDGAHPAARLEESARRLIAAGSYRFHAWDLVGRAKGALEADRRHLAALSPVATLGRGYSVAVDAHGRVARQASLFGPGDALELILSQGVLATSVLEALPAGSANSSLGERLVRGLAGQSQDGSDWGRE